MHASGSCRESGGGIRDSFAALVVSAERERSYAGAVTLPVGRDEAGMPVGLQLVAPGGRDEALLGAALAVERVLGSVEERLGRPDGL